jgi:small-conductance mechanosensitive channel
MRPILDFLIHNWTALAVPAAVLLLVLAAGWLFQRMVFRALERWSQRTATQLDDLLVEALRGPLMLWFLVLAVHLAVQSSTLPPRAVGLASKALLVLWIVSLTFTAAKLSGQLVKHYGGGLRGALPVTSITQNLASITVAIIGLLIVLNTLGISIAPILTALGVGGLAVALALQDTLSNLFAGFYMSIAGQVRTGDYIKLGSGEEGYVTDISWRSTTLKALPNNLIVVPNAKLAQAIVTNYHLPETRMSLQIPVGVSYESDPDDVESVLIEEATLAARDVPGLLADPAPFVRFIPGFGDSSLDFTLICQVSEFVDQYLAQHEIRKRILKRFRKEGIEIPFPIRTLQFPGGAPRETARMAPAAPSDGEDRR